MTDTPDDKDDVKTSDIDTDTDTLLGATFAGPEFAELAQAATLAVVAGQRLGGGLQVEHGDGLALLGREHDRRVEDDVVVQQLVEAAREPASQEVVPAVDHAEDRLVGGGNGGVGHGGTVPSRRGARRRET